MCSSDLGLLEVENIQQLAQDLDVDVLAKVIFSFTPDIVLSPLALPRHLLDARVGLLANVTSGALREVLLQLLNRPTFEQQWPDTYQAALVRGKRRILRLEHIRGDTYTMAHILAQDRELYDWWQRIRTD